MLLNWIMAGLILIAWLSAYNKLRKGNLTLGEFLLWSVLWIALLLFSQFPLIPSYIASLFGIGRGVDVVLYGSIFVLFFMMFKLYVRMESQQREMTKLVREVAIKRSRKK